MNRSIGIRRRLTAGLIALTMAFALSSCRVDLATTVNVADNGSGTITVLATADADAVRVAPELVDSLQLDDIKAAGWDVLVQNPAADGGIAVTLSRPFSNTDEATMFLSQLSGNNGPLRELSLTRTGGLNDARYVFSGKGGLPEGLAGFADADALEILGEAPFSDALTSQGLLLRDVLGISLRITMPGKAIEASGDIAPRADDDVSTSFSWSIPVDGPDLPIEAATRDRNLSALLASLAARGLMALLILLAAALVIYIATVAQRRNRSAPSS